MRRGPLHHRYTGVPQGFRPRGNDVSRVEGFSDAVFAFAVTLLVVSLEIPRNFQDLIQTMRGFGAFAVCFTLFMQIWFKHYGFFRRYGLQDGPTRLLNTVLLFIVLFYVYPLKYLWSHTVLVGSGTGFPPAEARILLMIYGLGGAAVFLIFAFLHQHAWRCRDELELNELERHDTRASIRENLLMASVPILSLLLALVLPATLTGLAGWTYLLYAPLMTWNGMRAGRGRRPLEDQALRDAPAIRMFEE